MWNDLWTAIEPALAGRALEWRRATVKGCLWVSGRIPRYLVPGSVRTCDYGGTFAIVLLIYSPGQLSPVNSSRAANPEGQLSHTALNMSSAWLQGACNLLLYRSVGFERWWRLWNGQFHLSGTKWISWIRWNLRGNGNITGRRTWRSCLRPLIIVLILKIGFSFRNVCYWPVSLTSVVFNNA